MTINIADFINIRAQVVAINDTYDPLFYQVRLGDTYIWVNDVSEIVPNNPPPITEVICIFYEEELLGIFDDEEKALEFKEKWMKQWKHEERPDDEDIHIEARQLNRGEL